MDAVKLWHDDVRPAPEGWIWARTNAEAMEILATGKVIAASLDHDMGNHELPAGTNDICPGSGMPQRGDETGYDLVQWMVANDHVPEWVRVHSWNYSGGNRMVEDLLRHSPNSKVFKQPYQHGEVLKCEF